MVCHLQYQAIIRTSDDMYCQLHTLAQTLANLNKKTKVSIQEYVICKVTAIFFRFQCVDDPLQWRHKECYGASNHQAHDCLLNRLFNAQIKENIKALRYWPLCGEFTGEFPAQMASNAENVSIWWRHHASSENITNIKKRLP